MLDQGQLSILIALVRAEQQDHRIAGINHAELDHLRDVLEQDMARIENERANRWSGRVRG